MVAHVELIVLLFVIGTPVVVFAAAVAVVCPAC